MRHRPQKSIDKIIAESVRNTINEMGTYRQNSFLRKLMGNRYKPEYDDLSVSDASRMIQQELDRQKSEQQSNTASEKQISFIENNNYYSIPTIRKIEGKLTKEDAKILVSALNPYTNGRYTYYGHAREKKETWLPQMRDAVVPVLIKYGMTEEAQRIKTEIDAFEQKVITKREKEQKQREEAEMEKIKNDPNTLFFISTKDEENLEQHQIENFSRNVWMDGKLEEKMSWDIAYLARDLTKLQKSEIDTHLSQMNGMVSYPTIVLGYDKPCRTLVWIGFDIMGRRTLCGRIVDATDFGRAYDLGKKSVFKQDTGDSI